MAPILLLLGVRLSGRQDGAKRRLLALGLVFLLVVVVPPSLGISQHPGRKLSVVNYGRSVLGRPASSLVLEIELSPAVASRLKDLAERGMMTGLHRVFHRVARSKFRVVVGEELIQQAEVGRDEGIALPAERMAAVLARSRVLCITVRPRGPIRSIYGWQANTDSQRRFEVGGRLVGNPAAVLPFLEIRVRDQRPPHLARETFY